MNQYITIIVLQVKIPTDMAGLCSEFSADLHHSSRSRYRFPFHRSVFHQPTFQLRESGDQQDSRKILQLCLPLRWRSAVSETAQ